MGWRQAHGRQFKRKCWPRYTRRTSESSLRSAGVPARKMRALLQDVGAVGDRQRLAHLVVGDQHADAGAAQIRDNFLNIHHGQRVNAGKGLVQKHEGRLENQGARDFQAAPLAAGKRVGPVASHGFQSHLRQQLLCAFAPLLRRNRQRLQYRQEILFHRQLAEHRRLLGKVADAAASPQVHGEVGDIVPVQEDATRNPERPNQPGCKRWSSYPRRSVPTGRRLHPGRSPGPAHQRPFVLGTTC